MQLGLQRIAALTNFTAQPYVCLLGSKPHCVPWEPLGKHLQEDKIGGGVMPKRQIKCIFYLQCLWHCLHLLISASSMLSPYPDLLSISHCFCAWKWLTYKDPLKERHTLHPTFTEGWVTKHQKHQAGFALIALISPMSGLYFPWFCVINSHFYKIK